MVKAGTIVVVGHVPQHDGCCSVPEPKSKNVLPQLSRYIDPETHPELQITPDSSEIPIRRNSRTPQYLSGQKYTRK